MVKKSLGQKWCNPKNINLKGSGYITIGTPDGLMVLCEEILETFSGITKYIPLKYEDLNIADKEDSWIERKNLE